MKVQRGSRRMQFTLASLFLIVSGFAVASAIFGIPLNAHLNDRRIVDQLEELHCGASATYKNGRVVSLEFLGDAPNILRDEDLILVKQLTALVHLDLTDTAVTKDGLMSLRTLSALKMLNVDEKQISEEDCQVLFHPGSSITVRFIKITEDQRIVTKSVQ